MALGSSYTGKATNYGSANPFLFNIGTVAGDTLVVLAITWNSTTSRAGGAPTFQGVAMSQVGLAINYGETSLELWYIINPSIGTYRAISIPNTGLLTLYGLCSRYAASTGYTHEYVGSDNKSGDGTTSPAVNLPWTGFGVAVSAFGSGSDTVVSNAGTDVTLYNADVGLWNYGNFYKLTSPATPSFTCAASEDWAICCGAWNEVASSSSSSSSCRSSSSSSSSCRSSSSSSSCRSSSSSSSCRSSSSSSSSLSSSSSSSSSRSMIGLIVLKTQMVGLIERKIQ